MTDARELIDAIDAAVEPLRRRGTRYFVTGSVASSMHGEFRATNDIDIVAALTDQTLEMFIADVSSAFVADLDQACEALAARTGFNLIHRSSFLKVDVFPLVSAFDAVAAERAEAVAIPGASGTLRVASREDILLAKLRWYRLGGDVSEVQRRDIEGLVALNRGALDMAHLREWAAALGIADLLIRFVDVPR